jgi:hypothetical protein
MNEPVISICIVTYKAGNLLRDCLNSIYQNPPAFPFEIIVLITTLMMARWKCFGRFPSGTLYGEYGE